MEFLGGKEEELILLGGYRGVGARTGQAGALGRAGGAVLARAAAFYVYAHQCGGRSRRCILAGLGVLSVACPAGSGLTRCAAALY